MVCYQVTCSPFAIDMLCFDAVSLAGWGWWRGIPASDGWHARGPEVATAATEHAQSLPRPGQKPRPNRQLTIKFISWRLQWSIIEYHSVLIQQRYSNLDVQYFTNEPCVRQASHYTIFSLRRTAIAPHDADVITTLRFCR